MSDPAKGSPEEKIMLAHTVDLLNHYSFDLGTKTANQHLSRWLTQYQAGWIRWAVIEALYQGRYKAISVDQILQLWQRRQHPCYHFSYEFERLVCHKFPRNLVEGRSPVPIAKPMPKPLMPPKLAPTPTEPAVLPTLPATNRVSASSDDPPAWAALAEQIYQEGQQTSFHSPPQSDTLPPAQPTMAEALDAAIDPAEVLSERVARLQAGVEALIEQATSSLNASSEAVKTRLKSEEELPPEEKLEETPLPEPSLSVPSSEEIHPPIHQFTPATDLSPFHSKLKAVVEQEVKE